MFTPIVPHNYLDGVCTVCGETLVTARIVCSAGASVTVYETQDLTGASEANAAEAHPRNSDTGLIDCAGTGQINFKVILANGYKLTSVTAEPVSAYKNLKVQASNVYRLTQVNGDLTITVTAERITGDINGDNKVNAKDRLLLSRYLAGWEGIEEKIVSQDALDIDKDGEITALDRVILSRYLAKWGGEYITYFE